VSNRPLTVAWINDFPVEWLPEVPPPVRHLPRRHPATWAMVLLAEFQKDPALRPHVILLRHRIERSFSFEQNGTQFHVLKAPVWLRLASVFWADTLLIRRLCRRIQPDLVHAWGMEKGAGAIAYRLPYPYVMTVQGLFGWYKERVALGRYDRFCERLERHYLPRAPVVTTESKFAVEFLSARYPKLCVLQAEHAPNRAFREIRRQPDTQPLHFITVGGLGQRKGTDLLLAALEQLLPELPFKLTIVSDPQPGTVEALQATASKALWERIEFKLHLLPPQVASQLERATMLLLPTRADTSPNAVKEAVVAGVPVVASSVGGIPDYVVPGKNGQLFTPGDLPGFVQALRTACAHPLFGQGQVEPETLARMRAYLSPEQMAKNFLGAYDTALAESPGCRTG
jgi:glycosyltransferase involved in cell wall biosynthesis